MRSNWGNEEHPAGVESEPGAGNNHMGAGIADDDAISVPPATDSTQNMPCPTWCTTDHTDPILGFSADFHQGARYEDDAIDVDISVDAERPARFGRPVEAIFCKIKHDEELLTIDQAEVLIEQLRLAIAKLHPGRPSDNVLAVPNSWSAERLTTFLDQLRADLHDDGDRQRAELCYPAGGGRIIKVVSS